MKMTKPEKTLKAWFYRAILGPAILMDGTVATLTLSTINAGLTLKCATNLAKARMLSK